MIILTYYGDILFSVHTKLISHKFLSISVERAELMGDFLGIQAISTTVFKLNLRSASRSITICKMR